VGIDKVDYEAVGEQCGNTWKSPVRFLIYLHLHHCVSITLWKIR
jgi:hypothetical protein